MSTHDTLLTAILLLIGLMFPVQLAAILKMRDDGNRGYTELAERHGMEMASAVSLLVFAGFAFIPPIVAKGDWTFFREMVPFNTFYYLIKTLLKVPPTNQDLKYVYTLMWSFVAFLIPAVVYGAINAKLASMIYGKMK